MTQKGEKAPVILTGMPRSGTTMLNGFARAYLQMASINEGPFELWLAGRAEADRSFADDMKLNRFLHELADHLYFRLLFGGDPPVAEIAEALRRHVSERTIQGIGRAVLRYTKEKTGGVVLGHEDPALIDDLSSVLKVFPDCQVIHILRDPRDAAASILQFPWGANNVYKYASEWNEKVAAARVFGADLGGQRYLEVKYEEILTRPRELMRRMMMFVHGDVNDERLDTFVQVMEKNPRRNNHGKWKKVLTEKQVRLIEAAAWEQMVACGYRAVFPRRRISAVEAIYWRFHNRSVQVGRILRGKLKANGAATPYFRPEHEEYPQEGTPCPERGK